MLLGATDWGHIKAPKAEIQLNNTGKICNKQYKEQKCEYLGKVETGGGEQEKKK